MSMTELTPFWDLARSTDMSSILRAGIALTNGYRHSWNGGWETEVVLTPELMTGWTVRASEASLWRRADLLLERDGAVLDLALTHGHLNASLDARSESIRDEVVRELTERFPQVEPKHDISVDFWFQTKEGPRSFSRILAAPTWPEISDNYPANVQVQIERLVAPSYVPGRGGQLLLWYGAPGSGKTFALRSLVREWSSWCSTSYVADVDAFLGNDAAYVVRLLLHEPAVRGLSEPRSDARPKRRWHLIVLEDAGELLAADAAQRSGQGFSRVLALTDGLLGTGLPVLVLVTTNEAIGHLHAAVSRPGRCASRIEFGALDAPSANRWLEAHGAPESLEPAHPSGALRSRRGLGPRRRRQRSGRVPPELEGSGCLGRSMAPRSGWERVPSRASEEENTTMRLRDEDLPRRIAERRESLARKKSCGRTRKMTDEREQARACGEDRGMSALSPRRRPFSEGGTEIVIALDDEAYEHAGDIPATLDGRPVLVVRARDLDDPDSEADLHYGAYRPTTPTCRQILTFAQNGAFALLEQDRAIGSVYRAGKLVWASSPVEVWNPKTNNADLAPMSDAALLFLDGGRVRLTTIPDVLVVYKRLTTRSPRRDEQIPRDWKARALLALRRIQP